MIFFLYVLLNKLAQILKQLSKLFGIKVCLFSFYKVTIILKIEAPQSIYEFFSEDGHVYFFTVAKCIRKWGRRTETVGKGKPPFIIYSICLLIGAHFSQNQFYQSPFFPKDKFTKNVFPNYQILKKPPEKAAKHQITVE